MSLSKQQSSRKSPNEGSTKKVKYTDEDVERIQELIRLNIRHNKKEIQKVFNYKTTGELKREKENQNLVCGIVRK